MAHPPSDSPRNRRVFPFYPFLIAAFPVLSLYASNQHELAPTVIVFPLIAALALAAAVLAGLRLIRRDRAPNNPLLVTALIVSLFAFGPLEYTLNGFARLTQEMAGNTWPIKVWLVVALIPLAGLIGLQMGKRKGRRYPRRLEVLITGTVIALLLVAPLIVLIQFDALPPLRHVTQGGVLLCWLTVVIVVFTGIFRIRRVPPVVHSILNNVALCLLAVPLASIFLSQFHARSDGADGVPSARETPSAPEAQSPPGMLPDIIHIVFDAYTRPEYLESEFGLDMDPFLNDLETRGFTIARKATSSYYLTSLSLSSMFNYQYVPLQEFSNGEKGTTLKTVQEYFWNNRLFDRLEALGYTTYSLESGFTITDGLPVDVAFRGERVLLRRFVGLILDLTPVRAIAALFGVESGDPYAETYERVMESFARLPELAARPSPKFILAHFPTPHLPIILDEEGKRLIPDPEFIAMTRDRYAEPPPEYDRFFREYYPRQVAGINRLLTQMLDRLIPELTRPTIILIQGDHGSELDYILRDPTIHTMKERYSTLNAIRFVGAPPDSFENDASLVNTYRIILNRYFGESLPLLEKRFFLHEGPEGRMVLIEVTEELTGEAPPLHLRPDPAGH